MAHSFSALEMFCPDTTYNQNSGTFGGVKIFFCHTTRTSLSTTFEANYSGNSPVQVLSRSSLVLNWIENQWNRIEFDGLFNYNGTDNLLIEIRWDSSPSGGLITATTYPFSGHTLLGSSVSATSGSLAADRSVFRLVTPLVTAKPVISPAGGTYSGSNVVVTISCATADATIRYTTNGVDVTAASPAYAGPFTLAIGTWTVKAKAFKAQMSDSLQAKSVFAILRILDLEKDIPQTNLSAAEGEKLYFRFAVPANVATLRFILTGGTGDGDLLVNFGSPADTNDYDYYPALGGNEETVTVSQPASGFWYATLLGSTGDVTGVQLTGTYEASALPAVATPTIIPAGGVKIGSVQVSITCATTGSTIRYTLDGSDPTANSTLYAALFELGPAPLKTVKARAFQTNMTDSAVASALYKIVRKISPGQTIVLSGAQGSLRYFAVRPPVGATRLNISLTGGTGNANLYVRKNLLPTVSIFNYRSVAAGNNELIQIPYPNSGKWYFILVKAKSAYTGASLRATIP